jgi:hypothetical protein
MVIDQLVARRAEQHQVVHAVDVIRAILITSRSRRPERDNVRHLPEIALMKRDWVLEEISVMAVELASATGTNT